MTVVATVPELQVALAAPRTSDLIEVRPGTYPGQFRSAAGDWTGTVIRFQEGAFLTGVAPGGGYGALYLDGFNGGRLENLDVTCPGGNGLVVDNTRDAVLADVFAHDTGDQGILVRGGPSFRNTNLTLLRPRTARCGTADGNTNTEPGYWRRGVHGIYWWGSSGLIEDALIQDQPCGAGIQIGDQTFDFTLQRFLVERVTAQHYPAGAPHDGAGNALNIWGQCVRTAILDGVVAELANRCVNTTGYYGGGDVLVDNIVGYRVAAPNGQPWYPKDGVSYRGCTISATDPRQPAPSLPLRLLRETSTRYVLGWDPVPCVGYRFQRQAAAPKWGHSWNPNLTETSFPKDSGWYRVQPLTAAGDPWEWRP